MKSDKSAAEELYKEFYPPIVLHLKRKFGNLISAEDVAQDVFLSLIQVSEFKFVEYPVTWFYKIADHKAIDTVKYQHPEIPITENFGEDFKLDNLILSEDTKKLLSILDTDSQKILYLHHWEGYKHKEIAELLNLSAANVRTKASRAYALIREFSKKS